MKIIIVGLGKVGQTLVSELSGEGNDITIIDLKEDIVNEIASQYDVMGLVGNGAIYSTQMEAGIENADLLIAVTTSDELNLLCCLIAKKAGNCHTIARVRNPEYATELSFIKEELGLAMVINPEEAAAQEIANSLKFPSAIQVSTFAKSRVELLRCRIPENSVLNNLKLSGLSKVKGKVLICAIERGDEIIIPKGNVALHAGDLISVVGTAKEANTFFAEAGIVTNQVKSIMIVGGSSIAYYLSNIMMANNVNVKIIEQDRARCEALCELLPKAAIIHGDGSDRELLDEEGIDRFEGFAALTNIDEENILISLYARKTGDKKIITKVNRLSFHEVVRELDLDTVIHPKNITSERIVRYVRSMKNSLGSNNVETLHRIIDGKAEALEFAIRNASKATNVPLQELKIKEEILIACISRKGKVIIPRGSDSLEIGDSVVVITKEKGLDDIDDILV